MLEPCEGKLSRTVLRGESGSNTADLLDQLIESKQKFISQIMTSKSPVRSCEDVDDTALSYAEVKALATGNPAIKEKMALDVEVSKLKLLKANFVSNHYRLEDDIAKNFPQQIAVLRESIEGFKADMEKYQANKITDPEKFVMEVGGTVFYEKKEAGAALLAVCQSMKQADALINVGQYQGFSIRLKFDSWNKEFILSLKNENVRFMIKSVHIKRVLNWKILKTESGYQARFVLAK